MLVPKRVKHRREFRGKMREEAKGGKEVVFGTYGLQATESHILRDLECYLDQRVLQIGRAHV